MSRLLVAAGEASGDLHAARLLARLRELCSGLEVFGLGGDELRHQGADLVAHGKEISVVGIVEALRILPRARTIFRQILEEVERRPPDAALLVDFPEFNLRLARSLSDRGVPVVYYVSPQVWAWRRRRVRAIARTVDRMLVLFPFEVDFYRDHDVEVFHVGHPLVDEVPEVEHVWDRQGTGEPFRIALLPGSRRGEVETLLPVMLASCELMAEDRAIEVRVIRAPSLDDDVFAAARHGVGVPAEVVTGDRFELLARSHLALCASGTATLETGLVGTPLVVIYKLQRWTYWLAKLLVRLPSVSLVNLVLGERVVPELIQGQAEPERVAREAFAILDDDARRGEMRRRLGELRGRLGESGASARAAERVAEILCPEEAA